MAECFSLGQSKAPKARCCCHCWESFMVCFCSLWFLRRFALPSILLIYRPSGGVFLSDVGGRASGSASSIPITLLGCGDCDCDRAGAGRSPAKFSPAAQLFTTSLRLAVQDRLARS